MHTLKRNVDNILNFIETLLSCSSATCLLEIKLQVLEAPLATVLLIIVICILLNGYICEVHHCVANVFNVGTILFVAKSGEAERAHPSLEWAVTSD